VAPAGPTTRSAVRVEAAETLRAAIKAGLEAPAGAVEAAA
jgi:hypothetical protein